ncbi:MAG: 4Fe-4S binding protein, partial [Betaproteobacteria bacterium]|nr:4Fe-4S binding protein [Betaproteobacteria bacterium]
VVRYASQGRLLLIGRDETRIRQAISGLGDSLAISLLWTGKDAAPQLTDIETISARVSALGGYLGAFALQFQATSGAGSAEFDLVMDFDQPPAFTMPQPPQGYFRVADARALESALAELPNLVGEFEKPTFFAYKESICAHSRSKKTGCTQCIDFCSTQAIRSDGDRVAVDPHLCMGCGACATVCPSGAMSYQYPRVADRGSQLRIALDAWRQHSTVAPLILYYDGEAGRTSLDQLIAQGGGLPAHVLPIEVWHIASVGLDLMLGAIAYGACGVAVLATDQVAPDYAVALRREMTLGDLLLNELELPGRHFLYVEQADLGKAFPEVGHAATCKSAAKFHLGNDKRTTLEFAIDHFLSEAKSAPVELALPEGSLYGCIEVDKAACTLCMACVGACPESALMDGGETPMLKFLERNCVQCGLCETTCPESAIRLQPRLLLTAERKQERVLNQAEPFNCISCGKALGTKQMIDNLLGKLAGHSMFQGEGQLRRLQMCADCRVVDMMANPHEMSILTGRKMP